MTPKRHLKICPAHVVGHSQRYDHLKKRRLRPDAGSFEHELCSLRDMIETQHGQASDHQSQFPGLFGISAPGRGISK